jgi:phenylacetate-CoA ligase
MPPPIPTDAVEALPYLELSERLEWPLLQRQLERLASVSPFYRDRLAGCRFSDPGVLAELPFTTKEDLLGEQAAYPPFGRLPEDVPATSLRRVHTTSGSSGSPLYIGLTARDIEEAVCAGRRAFLCAGVECGDVLVHCLNYCMWAGGVTDHLSLEAAGATVIPFGVGHTGRLIEVIRATRANAISCTPSYMARLQVVLQDSLGLAPRDLGLRKGFFGGEGGLQDGPVRGRIEETWGIQAIDANYGMSDVLSIFGSECPHRRGLHFHAQGLLQLELIDPVTNSPRLIRDGASGEMVLTSLTREAQPVLRYRTRDMVTIAGTGRCACGRTSLRFYIRGRSDDMVVVSGINVYPNAVRRLLSEKPAWFGGQFEMVLESPPPIQHLLLRAELAVGTRENDAARDWLLRQCQERLSFTPRLALLSYGDLPRTDGKTKHVRHGY